VRAQVDAPDSPDSIISDKPFLIRENNFNNCPVCKRDVASLGPVIFCRFKTDVSFRMNSRPFELLVNGQYLNDNVHDLVDGLKLK
jgi:hypothetical protein